MCEKIDHLILRPRAGEKLRPADMLPDSSISTMEGAVSGTTMVIPRLLRLRVKERLADHDGILNGRSPRAREVTDG